MSSILTIVILPVLIVIFAPIKKTNRTLFYLFASLLPVIGILLTLKIGYGDQGYSFGHVIQFSLDRYAYIYVLLVNTCWLLTILYSSAYVRHNFQKNTVIFHQLLALSVSCSLATSLASNFITIFIFYLAALPIIYPLIQIQGKSEHKQAAKIYILSTTLPAVLIALPVVSFHFPMIQTFGSFSVESLGYSHFYSSVLLALIIIGFSKSCIAPFHLWLPKCSVAPIPVTALVHSVSAIQTAIVILIKIATHVYGVDRLTELNDHFFETGWLTYLCGGTALYTAYRALKATDLKTRFSFSTVGQLSYMITAILVGTHQALIGAVLHMVTHALAKLNLLFSAGVFSTVIGTSEAPKVAEWVPHHRWLAIVAAVSGLSISGFPFLAGYYSKDLMLIEEVHKHHYAAVFFLIAGSVINLIYIYPIIKAALVGRKRPDITKGRIPLMMSISILLCSFLIILLSRYTFYISRVVE